MTALKHVKTATAIKTRGAHHSSLTFDCSSVSSFTVCHVCIITRCWCEPLGGGVRSKGRAALGAALAADLAAVGPVGRMEAAGLAAALAAALAASS